MSINNPPSYFVRTYTLAAGAVLPIFQEADFLAVLDDGGSSFKIRLDNGAQEEFSAGLMVRPLGGFESCEIDNTSGGTLTIQLAIGKGDFRDGRFTTTGTLTTEELMPGTLPNAQVSLTNLQASQIAAALSTRRELIMRNRDTAATVYISGNAGAAAGEGIELKPGELMVLETAAAVYGRNDSGAAVLIDTLQTVR